MRRVSTSDQEILETVTGERFEYIKPPVQQKVPPQFSWSDEQGIFMDSKIKNYYIKM